MKDAVYFDPTKTYEISASGGAESDKDADSIRMHVVVPECWSTGRIFCAGIANGIAFWAASGDGSSAEEIALDDEAFEEYFAKNADALNADGQDWLLLSAKSARLNFE